MESKIFEAAKFFMNPTLFKKNSISEALTQNKQTV